MANNKVQLANGTVLIDLTDTTATASDVVTGSYFYDAAGVKQSGTLVVDETYSVSKTLTNVTSSNDDSKVIAGNSFYADLTPTSGYAITSITVTMGGVDVTEQVFQPGTGAKAITTNGTYTAANDNLSGYDRVVVNVPNTYASSDEGKVVSGSALVAQTSDTVTQNGTVDTTLINSLTVNVSGEPTEMWDYEWNYTDGLLSNNGWTMVTSGTSAETMASDGVRLSSGSSGYISARNPSEFNNAVGVMEVDINVNAVSSGNNPNVRLCLGNGTNGIQLIINSDYWRQYNNSTFSSCTICAISFTKMDYTVRLELNNGVGTAYINGLKVVNAVATSGFPYSLNTSVWSQSQNSYITVKGIRIKKNRL